MHLQAEDVPLNAAGACFATIDTAISASSGDPEKLLSFTSSVGALPEGLLRQFRTVSMLQPDLPLLMDVLLTSKGNSDDCLSQKLVHVRVRVRVILISSTGSFIVTSKGNSDDSLSRLLVHV